MTIPIVSKKVRRMGTRGKGHGADNYVRIPKQNYVRPAVVLGTNTPYVPSVI